jgi:hypothetical protein
MKKEDYNSLSCSHGLLKDERRYACPFCNYRHLSRLQQYILNCCMICKFSGIHSIGYIGQQNCAGKEFGLEDCIEQAEELYQEVVKVIEFKNRLGGDERYQAEMYKDFKKEFRIELQNEVEHWVRIVIEGYHLHSLKDEIKKMIKCTDQWIEDRVKVLIEERLGSEKGCG